MKKYSKILSVIPAGAGHMTVEIERYGKILSGTLNIMPLYDAWKSGERGWKDAGNRIYDIIKNQN